MAKLPESKLIKELAELLEATQLSEIEVETDGTRIRVARQFSAPPAQVAPAPMPPPAAAPNVETPAPPANTEAVGMLKSPMVGTAYLSPEPSKPAFVKVGDMVEKGQTVLIIEAMKTMNPITALHSGKVTKIVITNEQPVEYNEDLMIIEP